MCADVRKLGEWEEEEEVMVCIENTLNESESA